ncbi:unnamed protein product, partial [Polarella glacialis]
MAADEAEDKFKHFLKEAMLEPEVITYMINDAGMKAIADFAGYFGVDDYEAGVQADILQKTSFADNRIQLSRLRVACLKAREATKTAASSNIGAAAEEWEATLDPAVREAQEGEFTAAYRITFPPETSPAEHVYNRIYREFKRGNKHCEDLTRMRSAADVAAVLPQLFARIAFLVTAAAMFDAFAEDLFKGFFEVAYAGVIEVSSGESYGIVEFLSRSDALEACMQFNGVLLDEEPVRLRQDRGEFAELKSAKRRKLSEEVQPEDFSEQVDE